jgi:hypothetical protein
MVIAMVIAITHLFVFFVCGELLHELTCGFRLLTGRARAPLAIAIAVFMINVIVIVSAGACHGLPRFLRWVFLRVLL